MARIKAAKDRLYATKTKEKGLLIVHTGTGKGKSTAAWGLAMRCLGHGLSWAWCSSSRAAACRASGPFLERFPELATIKVMGEGFTWETQDRARDVAAARAAFDEAKLMLQDPELHLVILDELNIVLRYDTLPLAEVLAALAATTQPARRGHRPQRQARADRGCRSRHRMRLVKHPFRDGIKGQLGVEF